MHEYIVNFNNFNTFSFDVTREEHHYSYKKRFAINKIFQQNAKKSTWVVYSYLCTLNVANFEAFGWNILLSAKLLFLKSWYIRVITGTITLKYEK